MVLSLRIVIALVLPRVLKEDEPYCDCIVGSPPTPFPPPSHVSKLSLFLSLHVCRWSSLLTGERGGHIIRPRESLALYSSFSTLCHLLLGVNYVCLIKRYLRIKARALAQEGPCYEPETVVDAELVFHHIVIYEENFVQYTSQNVSHLSRTRVATPDPQGSVLFLEAGSRSALE